MSNDGAVLWTPQKKLGDIGALPVKVRTLSGALIGSGVSGQPIPVPAGEYLVCALMPNGHEIGAMRPVRVGKGQTVSPRIMLPEETVRDEMTTRANPVALQMSASVTSETGAAPASAGRQIDAMRWSGRWLDDWASPQVAMASGLQAEPLTLTETEQAILLADEQHDRFLITKHEADGRKILRFTIVPHDECIGCVGEERESPLILAAIREGSDPPAVKYASSASDETNSLLNFVDAGVLGEMQTVSAAFVNLGESAILQAKVSLLRGVTGAYVMLRANVLDGLEPFLHQLGEMAPGLPDRHILQAETFARLGRHKEAAAAISDATEALCPWFRAGISYLIERLRLYLDLDDKESKATLGLDEDEWERFRHAKARLERMAPMMVVSQVFTTFDIPE